MLEIGKDTVIGDLLDAEPEAESVLDAYGMPCRLCSSAHGETIETACMLHEVDVESVLAALQTYFAEK